MSTETNTAIVRRWFDDFWNMRNVDTAGELLHPNYTSQDGLQGAQALEGAKAGQAFWLQVFPDLLFTLDEVIAAADTVVARWTARGTHQGDWVTPIGTIPATGKDVITPGTSTYHFRDGKIIQDWNHIDFLSSLEQMGVAVRTSETG